MPLTQESFTRKFTGDQLHCFDFGLKSSFELAVFNCRQNFLEEGPGSIASRGQIISGYQRGLAPLLPRSRRQLLLREPVGTQVPAAGLATHAVQVEVLLEA